MNELTLQANVHSISIVIPAYDDAENVGVVIEEALATLAQLTDNYEVVVVDDVSTDNTREVLSRYAAANECVRVYFNEQNLGCHATELKGFGLANGDVFFFIPSDRQIMPDQLPRCLAAMANADFVCTNRVIRADPLYRKAISNCYNFSVRVLFHVPVHDVNSSILVRREVIERIGAKIKADSSFISVELVVRALHEGFRIAEVPIEHHPRIAGKARGLRPRDIVKIVYNVIFLWFYLIRLRADIRREKQ